MSHCPPSGSQRTASPEHGTAAGLCCAPGGCAGCWGALLCAGGLRRGRGARVRRGWRHGQEWGRGSAAGGQGWVGAGSQPGGGRCCAGWGRARSPRDGIRACRGGIWAVLEQSPGCACRDLSSAGTGSEQCRGGRCATHRQDPCLAGTGFGLCGSDLSRAQTGCVLCSNLHGACTGPRPCKDGLRVLCCAWMEPVLCVDRIRAVPGQGLCRARAASVPMHCPQPCPLPAQAGEAAAHRQQAADGVGALRGAAQPGGHPAAVGEGRPRCGAGWQGMVRGGAAVP